MPLIVCPCCGRRRNVEKRKRGRLRCTNCGAAGARVIKRLKHWMETSDNDGVDRETARHQTFAQLKWYAEMKGFKPGWAGWKFKTLFGSWPNGESNEPPAGNVGQDLMRWFWRQAAEHAANMRKAEAAKVKPKEPEPKSPYMTHEDYGTKL